MIKTHVTETCFLILFLAYQNLILQCEYVCSGGICNLFYYFTMEKPLPLKNKLIALTDARMGDVQCSIDKILMASTVNHKVKVLVLTGKEHAWYERSGSLTKLLGLLTDKKFERVNKFYILNWDYFHGFNRKKKEITFTTKFTIRLSHTIKAAVFKNRLL